MQGRERKIEELEKEKEEEGGGEREECKGRREKESE